eukprot:1147886-Pelagomonas_calceolata.AAC.3
MRKICVGRFLFVECSGICKFRKARRPALPTSMEARPAPRVPLLILLRRILLAIMWRSVTIFDMVESLNPGRMGPCAIFEHALFHFEWKCWYGPEGVADLLVDCGKETLIVRVVSYFGVSISKSVLCMHVLPQSIMKVGKMCKLWACELGRSDVLAWEERAVSSKAGRMVSWKGFPSRLTRGKIVSAGASSP